MFVLFVVFVFVLLQPLLELQFAFVPRPSTAACFYAAKHAHWE